MIRILLFTLAVVAAAAGFAWLADRPGTITVEWLGYQIEASAFVGMVAVGLLVVLLIAAWATAPWLSAMPASPDAICRANR
jgi:HemY protein